MSIILFEDNHVSWLYPITIGRPAFRITCGSYRLSDLVDRLGQDVRWIVRDHLREALSAEMDSSGDAETYSNGSAARPVMLINAALVPSPTALSRLEQLLSKARPCVVRKEGRVAMALLKPQTPPPPQTLPELTQYLATLDLPEVEADLPLFEYPHDVVRHHMAILNESLADRLHRSNYREVADGLFVAEGVTLGEHLVSDTRNGPIVVEEHARIGPYCYLSGPAHIGPHARIIDILRRLAVRSRPRLSSPTPTSSTMDSWATVIWEAGSTSAPAPATATSRTPMAR
jgi:UDP-N-acetylglucosamine diphosphorylase / glucose-1-phosphate thymidylyltransferase / UDP-N-acetylgalactosamine diphosphorylase / glucosamine-1-phosphate N-acetyltransferase / galactosamine-1-phosphate N-acetyltransferase